MSSLPLLCALGRHRTDPLAQWNDGYYFARCKRCGHDLVRTAFGDWTIPQGYRVVWAAEAPASDPATLVREDARLLQPSAGRSSGERNGVATSGRFETLQASKVRSNDSPERLVEFPIRDIEPAAVDRQARMRNDTAVAEVSERGVAVADTVVVETDGVDASDDQAMPHAREKSLGESSIFRDFRSGPAPYGYTAEPVASDVRQGDAVDADAVDADGDAPPATNGYDRTPAFLLPALLHADAPFDEDVAMEEDDDEDGIREEGKQHDDETVGQSDLFAETPAPPQPPRYLVIPDFMDGTPLDIPYDLQTGEMLTDKPAQSGHPAELARDPAGEWSRGSGSGGRESGPTWRDAVRDRAQAVAESGLNFVRSRRSASDAANVETSAWATSRLSVPLAAASVSPGEASASSPVASVVAAADGPMTATAPHADLAPNTSSTTPAMIAPVEEAALAAEGATAIHMAAKAEASPDALSNPGGSYDPGAVKPDFARFEPAALRRGRPSRPRSVFERHAGLAAAAVFGGFVLAAALVEKAPDDTARLMSRLQPAATERSARAPQPKIETSAPAAPVPASTVAPAPSLAPGGDQAFVTASLLNCRSIPSDDGETVRRLTRGAAVRVLGAGPGWISVSHQGRQCWASAQFISTTRPL